MVSKQLYYAYGEVRWSTGATPATIGFTAQRSDEGNGLGSLMFYNARYYSPLLSRFISADSIVPGAGNPQAFNRYMYVSGNPLRLIDPTGHACYDIINDAAYVDDCPSGVPGYDNDPTPPPTYEPLDDGLPIPSGCANCGAPPNPYVPKVDDCPASICNFNLTYQQTFIGEGPTLYESAAGMFCDEGLCGSTFTSLNYSAQWIGNYYREGTEIVVHENYSFGNNGYDASGSTVLIIDLSDNTQKIVPLGQIEGVGERINQPIWIDNGKVRPTHLEIQGVFAINYEGAFWVGARDFVYYFGYDNRPPYIPPWLQQ